MRPLRFLFGILGACCLLLFGFLLALYLTGTDPELYYRLQMRADVLRSAGIDEATLRSLDRSLADCLKGDARWNETEEGDVRVCEVFGKAQPAFNARELTHMEDCQRLFGLLRRALWTVAAGALAFVCFGLRCASWRERRIRLLGGAAVIMLSVGGFALYAIVDFDAAFTLFHRVLFSNDLWLLDPRTDLLIRLCPASMFMTMGALIAVLGTIWSLIAACILWNIKDHNGRKT